MLVEAEHLAMEEIMADVADSDVQPPVAMVCRRHLETVLQRVSPSVKVQCNACLLTYFPYCIFNIYSAIRLSSRKCVINSVFSVV